MIEDRRKEKKLETMQTGQKHSNKKEKGETVLAFGYDAELAKRKYYADKAYELEVVSAEDDDGPPVVLVIELLLELAVMLALLLLTNADEAEDTIRKRKRAYALPRQM